MHLILTRHYRTQFNADGLIMGWGDSPRVDDWLDEVQQVEQTLREHAVKPQLIVASALGRSLHTAEYYTHSLQVSELEVCPELNEINYGSLYGKPKKWAAEQYPGHKKDPDFVYPEGESARQLQQRTVAFVRNLARFRSAQTVLCVAHSGVVRALVSHFLDLEYPQQLKRKVPHRYIGVMDFQDDVCVSYQEWGQPSGFVTAGEVVLPYSRASA